MQKSNGCNARIFISVSIIVFFTVIACACAGERTDGIWVSFDFNKYVVDDNGSIIDHQTNIYDIDGVLSNTNWQRSKGFGAGITINGSSRGSGRVWPVYPEDHMVFGASTNNSSLQSDWDNKRFSPGSAGNWTIFTYEDIAKHMVDNQTAYLNVTIYISNKTGMMIER